MANYATEQHSYGCLGGPRRGGQDDAGRGAASARRARSRPRAAWSGARRSPTSIRSKSSTSTRSARRCCHCDTNGTRIHLDRHAGISRFHRPVDRRARRRRDRRDRRQRADRHRDDHVAHDGLGGRTASSAASSSSTRSTPTTSTRRRCSQPSRQRSARNACRSTCPPTAASASSTASSIRRATSDFSSVEAAHAALVDQVVEVDEELMALYLEKGEVEPEQLHAPFEKALREGHLDSRSASCRRAPARASASSWRSSTSSCPTRRKAIRRASPRAKARARSSSTPSPIRRSTCSRTCSRS